MKIFSSASHCLGLTAVLPMLAISYAATAATARKAGPHARATVSARASSDIIALPLYPIIPAGQRLCTARTASGLGYTILRPASGARPTSGDIVLVNYIGYLAKTGAVFDQGTNSPLPVDGVIPGFAEGLKMMAKSGIARFCVPATLGYGARATGPIPAASDLVFQVEFVDSKTNAEVERMNNAQAVEATTPADGSPPPK